MQQNKLNFLLVKLVCLLVINVNSFVLAEKFKVLVTHPDVPPEVIELLSQTTEVIRCNSIPVDPKEVLEKAKGVHALYWAHYDPLTREVIEAVGPQLKVVTVVSAGTNYVDVEELKKRRIPFGHTPKVLSAAVADVAMGLMLSAARRFHEGRQKIESSNYETSRLNWLLGQDISGATVGFFGFGNIGQLIAKRLSGFDTKEILYTTRHRIDEQVEQKFNAKKADFSTMLSKSDIVFVAAPLTNETMGVFNATAFGKMKPNAVFVNIARGKIVNSKDLYDALKSERIFAAGLDVVDPEPLPSTDPLLSLPNCVITPHIGSATHRTRLDMSILAANNILKGLVDEPLPAAVY